MNRLARLLCFLSLTAGAQDVPDAGTAVRPERPPCPALEDSPEEGPASEVLGAFQLSIGGELQSLSGVELTGFERLSETQVRAFAHPPQGLARWVGADLAEAAQARDLRRAQRREHLMPAAVDGRGTVRGHGTFWASSVEPRAWALRPETQRFTWARPTPPPPG